MQVFKIRLIALLALLVWSLNAQVKTAKQTDQPGKTNLNYEYALNDPYNTRIYTLKNGLKVYLSVYKDAPRIQTMIAVKAGSKNDPSDATGLAHYLEHMLFKGSDKFGTKNYNKELVEIKKIEDLYEVYRKTKDEQERKKLYRKIDSISGVAARYAIPNEYDKAVTAIGAQGTNAYTSFDKTVYINDIPSNQIENWLKLEAERFRKPVLRLFHTELEAVYEEKNRGLDSDNDKAFEAMFEELFPTNKYGTQTTIGTIEHLKNPSLVEIKKFYDTWYIPNNMAIIMSGDFDPDKVIVQIEKHFGTMPTKQLAPYVPSKEQPIAERKYREIVGPDPESVNLSWRVDGLLSTDAEMMDLINALLVNYKAGIMDINLFQTQKVLEPFAWFYPMKDYGVFTIGASPKQGQRMEEVEKLLMEQIQVLRSGNFDDWLLEAVITDFKLNKTKELESNSARAAYMSEAFINEGRWQYMVDRLERMSKITKDDIVKFANERLKDNNYVAIYKRLGEDNNVVKVDKPEITPVEVDRENTSPFIQSIYNAKPEKIQPVFIDYEKDITRLALPSDLPVYYNKNNENQLFELYYKYEMGTVNNKTLPIAVQSIEFAGTKNMTSAQVKQELFKLGCSFNVFSSVEDTWVSLTGLSQNFEKAITLMEQVLRDPVIEEETLENLVDDVLKTREDHKLQKGIILNRALGNYARYGAVNPFTYGLSNEELQKLNVAAIKEGIKMLSNTEHAVLYYGPMNSDALIDVVGKVHKAPQGKYKPAPEAFQFTVRETGAEVFVVDFEMKQAEILMIHNAGAYNPELIPVIELFNNYFGNGMSGVVFQDLRESKALAYSVYSRLMLPNRPDKPMWSQSYIGSQVDKLSEAMTGMKDLLNNLPKSSASFAAAKENLLQEISSARINKAQILFNYLQAKRMNQSTDIRQLVYNKTNSFQFEDINKFHKEFMKDKKSTVLVVGKKDNLDFKVLEKYGTVKELSLKEIFGY